MMEITGTSDWNAAHPGAMIGLLELSGVDNTRHSPVLNERKRQVEQHLRREYAGYSRKDFLALPVMAAYTRYYRQFEKTYHVLLQVESLALRGRNLPDVSPLVDANYTAEVETLVLTAGHDADRLLAPVVIDVSRPGDELAPMNGPQRVIQAGDMVMRDREEICCTILYGQDNRSPITVETRHVLYVAYCPAGVPHEAVEAQLTQIEKNVHLFSPEARLEQRLFLEA
jgi:DNA/RNA-binding domain of Phe-tRNA-synthetase-like protein